MQSWDMAGAHGVWAIGPHRVLFRCPCPCPHGLPKLWLSLLPCTVLRAGNSAKCADPGPKDQSTLLPPLGPLCPSQDSWAVGPGPHSGNLRPLPSRSAWGNCPSSGALPSSDFPRSSAQRPHAFPPWGLICLWHNKNNSWTTGYFCFCLIQIPGPRNYRA